MTFYINGVIGKLKFWDVGFGQDKIASPIHVFLKILEKYIEVISHMFLRSGYSDIGFLQVHQLEFEFVIPNRAEITRTLHFFIGIVIRPELIHKKEHEKIIGKIVQ